jgi:hypothetical protein
MSKKIKISALEYDKLGLLVKDKLASDIPKHSELYEHYEDLAKRLKLKAEEIKAQEESKTDLKDNKKKQWKCDVCHNMTTIKMVKRCESCQSYDSVRLVV